MKTLSYLAVYMLSYIVVGNSQATAWGTSIAIFEKTYKESTTEEIHLPDSLSLQTRAGRDIANDCTPTSSCTTQNQYRLFDRKFPDIEKRTAELPFYNCHGLVFASRRTWITESQTLSQIIHEDGYVEITNLDEVQAGDILVYYDEKGDYTHSAIVVTRPTAERLRVPTVLSKWASYCEVIHHANYGPYREEFANAKYYRIR